MANEQHIAMPTTDPLMTVAVQIPASKAAVLRRCADLLTSSSPQGRAIENIIRVVAEATTADSFDQRPGKLGSAA